MTYNCSPVALRHRAVSFTDIKLSSVSTSDIHLGVNQSDYHSHRSLKLTCNPFTWNSMEFFQTPLCLMGKGIHIMYIIEIRVPVTVSVFRVYWNNRYTGVRNKETLYRCKCLHAKELYYNTIRNGDFLPCILCTTYSCKTVIAMWLNQKILQNHGFPALTSDEGILMTTSLSMLFGINS